MTNDTDIQRSQVFDEDFKVRLKSACTLNDGIMKLSEDESNKALKAFNDISEVPAFFVPASGSGSRMFQLIFDWLENNDEEKLNELKETLSVLAIGADLKKLSPRDFAQELIDRLSNKPKGLIPFHTLNGQSLTAFQEHVLQVNQLFPDGVRLHFTVQKEFENEIRENLKALNEELNDVEIDYSYQRESTNATCFQANQELFFENGELLKRPAGHGALLENLNDLQADLVFIKNIDNVQHYSKSAPAQRQWKLSAGLIMLFKADLRALLDNFSAEGLIALNNKYQFLSKEQADTFSREEVERLAQRPTRVCGMVINEGEPGGGPFWIEDNGHTTKQIIEKVQISDSADQQYIVQSSSHFNPVFIVVSKSDAYGNHLDLMKFRDDTKHFVVQKTHKGEEVLYRELPGLWNGSMSDWNTLFLEIPSEVFSPVKTILDLSKDAHIA